MANEIRIGKLDSSVFFKKGFLMSAMVLLPIALFASEPVIYTFEGKKDPRLEATFSVIYKGTSNAKECTQQNPSTATRKPMLAGKSYRITEENYHIEIPVYQQETDGQCGYQFRRIELVLRRQYDKELYSAHILLDTEQEVSPIYYGYKTGIKSGGHPLMPGTLFTDKQYFRIATESNYFCRTKFYTRLSGDGFYCFMKIRDGQGKNQFIKPTENNRVTHPDFGVNEMRSEIFQINIFADDEGSKAYTGKGTLQDYFRTLPKPTEPKQKPLSWEELKEKVTIWFTGWFE
ncbi:hypothetical protein [Thiomicrorhabdus sp. Kp2]|uniref:hypothetical protein n=1 Tax=Thiomicrorhabdus sp. Kp2 TaxID=1123518 RepID=UPI000413346E|nr:hypothetical protein [Thiomicrorhabdus sp. Kp2]